MLKDWKSVLLAFREFRRLSPIVVPPPFQQLDLAVMEAFENDFPIQLEVRLGASHLGMINGFPDAKPL